MSVAWKMLFLAMVVFSLAVLGGCSTPQEGGSSLPWSRPEPWEGQFKGAPAMSY